MASRLTHRLTQGPLWLFTPHEKEGVYYYRRRIPDYLGTDVALSLGMRHFREAEHLAELLGLIYGRSVNTVTSPTDLRVILRAYLESALEDDTTMRLSVPRGRLCTAGWSMKSAASLEPTSILSRSV